MDRFRPNIVVSGCTNAFDEDSWLLIEIGNVKFMAYNKAEVKMFQVYIIVFT